MVNWYKHDIPAWMDSTESLSDGAYRVHHVICQLIYLNEGPIAVNERGIAGRCNMHVLAFRKHLNHLLTTGKLTLNPDQTLGQPRANLELERIGTNRVNAGLGGHAKSKSLKNNDTALATLKETSAHKTRLEETREEKKESSGPVAKATRTKGGYSEKFEEAWRGYPRRDGGNPKPPAEKIFLAAVKAGADPQEIIDGAKRFAIAEVKNVGTPYIPQMVKWLRDKRWLDYGASAEILKFDIRAHLI